VTIFTVWFQNFPNNFVIFLAAVALAGGFVYIFARAALVAEGGRQPWARKMTAPNTKLLFAVLMVLWAIVFGIGLQLVPHEGASSPYGGIGLIAMFSGFFILMGLIWSVIGE
jgi:hypothetical protein